MPLDWLIAPNPANSILNVSVNNPLPENYVIYIQKLMGQAVAQKMIGEGSKQVMFDVSTLPGGTYLSQMCRSVIFKHTLKH